MEVNYKKLVRYYIILSCILIVGIPVAYLVGIGFNFFIITNTLNALLCSFLFLFKKTLTKTMEGIVKIYNDIQSKSDWLQIDITYKNQFFSYVFLVVPAMALGFYATYLAFTDSRAYLVFISEDGVVEYLSALSWALAALCLTIYVVTHNSDSRIHGQGKYLIVMIVLFVFCCGEEISWGQRIIGFRSPDLMQSINIQHETNLHNIGSISVFSNAFFFLTSLYFVILPFLYWKRKEILYTLSYLNIPFPERVSITTFSIGLLFWLIIGLRFGTLGFHPFCFYDEKFYTQMDDEIFEFFAAYTFFVFSVMRFMTRFEVTEKECHVS